MTQQQSGRGFVALDTFLEARLAEQEGQTLDARAVADIAARRRIIAAHRASRSLIYRAGIEVALKALAGVWSDHPDFDPRWRP